MPLPFDSASPTMLPWAAAVPLGMASQPCAFPPHTANRLAGSSSKGPRKDIKRALDSVGFQNHFQGATYAKYSGVGRSSGPASSRRFLPGAIGPAQLAPAEPARGYHPAR